MANNAIKISNLAITTTMSANDRVVVLANTSSTAILKTITLTNLTNKQAIVSNTAPISNTATGTTGQLAYSNTFIYVCVSGNTWARAALTLSW